MCLFTGPYPYPNFKSPVWKDTEVEPMWRYPITTRQTIRNPNKESVQVVLPGGGMVVLKPGQEIEVNG